MFCLFQDFIDYSDCLVPCILACFSGSHLGGGHHGPGSGVALEVVGNRRTPSLKTFSAVG